MNSDTIVTAALRRLLVVGEGITPSSTKLTVGREVLNDLINSYSANNNLIYEDTYEVLTIPVSTQEITIGSTGTLSTGRPLKIKIATLKDNNVEYPMKIIDEKEYQRYSNKTSITRPYKLYYRNTWPNGTMYFESTTDREYTLILTSLKQLSTFPDGTTDVALPDHYERFLKTNLTIEIAPEMGAANRVTQIMIEQARESKKAVIGQAIDIVPSQTELPTRSNYNIQSDGY